MHFFCEELVGNTIDAKSPIEATIAMSDRESWVSVTVPRTRTEGEGSACKSEPLPLTES